MNDSIIAALTAASAAPRLADLGLALAVSLGLGLALAAVYRLTQRRGPPAPDFVLTLVLLPPTIAAIILLVGTNIASAFSLSGAFAIIRFRSAPGNPKDISWVLACMAVGLAAGLGYPAYALAIALALAGTMLLLGRSRFGRVLGASDPASRSLKITVPEDLDFEGAFDDVLAKYAAASRLEKVKTADLGSLYQLEYAVALKEGSSAKAFIDELRCRNGNLPIVLGRSLGGAGLAAGAGED